MYGVHTHLADGKIHLESPQARDFTLKEFFQVWGKVFNRNQILDRYKDQNDELTMTVDGSLSNDWENLVMNDSQQIIISFNTK